MLGRPSAHGLAVNVGIERHASEAHPRRHGHGCVLDLERPQGQLAGVLLHSPPDDQRDHGVDRCVEHLFVAQVRRCPVRRLQALVQLDPEVVLGHPRQRPPSPARADGETRQLLGADEPLGFDPAAEQEHQLEGGVVDHQLPRPQLGESRPRHIEQVEHVRDLSIGIAHLDEADLGRVGIEASLVLRLGLGLAGPSVGHRDRQGWRLGAGDTRLDVETDAVGQRRHDLPRAGRVVHLLDLDPERRDQVGEFLRAADVEQAVVHRWPAAHQSPPRRLVQAGAPDHLQVGAVPAERRARLHHAPHQILQGVC